MRLRNVGRMKNIYNPILQYAVALAVFVAAFVPAYAQAEEIIISAAASLTNALESVGDSYMAAHPETRLLFNFAASGALLQQIAHGAPVDVFASANQAFMDRAEKENLIQTGSRRDFARNRLILAVPAAGKAVQNITDLGKNGALRIAIGNPQTVPAGRYARQALQGYGLWDELKDSLILATSVRQVLDYLRRGEIDAGLVYSTDCKVTGDAVRRVQAMETADPVVYCIAVTRTSGTSAAGMQFVNYLRSDQGQAILTAFGFEGI